MAARDEDFFRLKAQISERENSLPLRERIQQIFKKYGVAVFLAAGITIGAVLGAMTNALKKLGTDLGNGLKAVEAKAANALPGLIGSIVGFLFKAAGGAIGFRAEHTWLLILAVVAFLFQKLIKKKALTRCHKQQANDTNNANNYRCFVNFMLRRFFRSSFLNCRFF